MIGSTAAQVSFAAASALWDELGGLRVPVKQVERAAGTLGAAIAADERKGIEPEPARAPTVYLGMDGTGVPMRPIETVGRPGRHPDGRARSSEAKGVTCWTAEARHPKTQRPMRDPGSVRYSAAIESAAMRDTDAIAAPFVQRVQRLMARCSYAEARRQVVLGDGAAWIWHIADTECSGAIQIVDLWHAKEKLWEAGRALWGAGERTEAWAHARCEDLEGGRFRELLAALRPHAATCHTVRRCLGYLETNRERMRYDEFRAQGLCVGSGVVEAGCKTVVGSAASVPGCAGRGRGPMRFLPCDPAFSVEGMRTTGSGKPTQPEQPCQKSGVHPVAGSAERRSRRRRAPREPACNSDFAFCFANTEPDSEPGASPGQAGSTASQWRSGATAGGPARALRDRFARRTGGRTQRGLRLRDPRKLSASGSRARAIARISWAASRRAHSSERGTLAAAY